MAKRPTNITLPEVTLPARDTPYRKMLMEVKVETDVIAYLVIDKLTRNVVKFKDRAEAEEFINSQSDAMPIIEMPNGDVISAPVEGPVIIEG